MNKVRAMSGNPKRLISVVGNLTRPLLSSLTTQVPELRALRPRYRPWGAHQIPSANHITKYISNQLQCTKHKQHVRRHGKRW